MTAKGKHGDRLIRPRNECMSCGGFGKVRAEPIASNDIEIKFETRDRKCPRCAGRGYHETKQYRVPR